MKRIQLCVFTTWASGLALASDHIQQAPGKDLRAAVSRPGDAELLRKARLDFDWYVENVRCFSSLEHPGLTLAPTLVAGVQGLLPFAAQTGTDAERWVLFSGHQPQALGALTGKVCELMRRAGVRLLFYAFDEASRHMAGFKELAPHLSVLIHDEFPLDAQGERLLPRDCLRVHRSWVANVVPFACPFEEAPEERIVFLGSQLGLTPHRARQIAFLQERFKDRFVASCDHSVAVADRFALRRFKVGLAPEGRKFTTPAMAQTHTDRPFWCGCMGMMPVSENSRQGGRLESLAANGLIERYAHGDLRELEAACERALAASDATRRRVYEHFNREETVGVVVARALAAWNASGRR